MLVHLQSIASSINNSTDIVQCETAKILVFQDFIHVASKYVTTKDSIFSLQSCYIPSYWASFDWKDWLDTLFVKVYVVKLPHRREHCHRGWAGACTCWPRWPRHSGWWPAGISPSGCCRGTTAINNRHTYQWQSMTFSRRDAGQLKYIPGTAKLLITTGGILINYGRRSLFRSCFIFVGDQISIQPRGNMSSTGGGGVSFCEKS